MTKILTARKYKSNNPFTKYLQMLLCQYYGGGIYWVCSNCGCKAERTRL